MQTCAQCRPGLASRFFFFQAEDGIRDDLVTGVQTCALPVALSTTETHRHYSYNMVFRSHESAAAARPPGPRIRHAARRTQDMRIGGRLEFRCQNEIGSHGPVTLSAPQG